MRRQPLKSHPRYGGPRKSEDALPPKITVIDYDEQRFDEKEIRAVEDLRPYLETATVTWINVCGSVGPDLQARLGELFRLHPLTIEDIAAIDQRPKVEDVLDYLYLSVKMFCYHEESGEVSIEQVSFVIGKNFVLSFEQSNDGLFEPIREKLRKYKGRIRKMGTDYLAYRLLGAVVDGYFRRPRKSR